MLYISPHLTQKLWHVSTSRLKLAHAWSHRLFEAWLVSGCFKVDLLGDIKVFLPALSQYNLNRFFLAQI